MEQKDDWKEGFKNWLSKDNYDLKKAFNLKKYNMPSSIFKYRELNDYSIDNLQNDAIWLADPNEFNDPYDSACSFGMNEDPIEFAKSYDVKGARTYENSQETPNPNILEGIKIMESIQNKINNNEPLSEIENTTLETIEKELKHANEKTYYELENLGGLVSTKSNLRVCSFSETNDNILMWSHYTKYHKGFCIEYGTSDLTKLACNFLLPIIYFKNDTVFNIASYNGKIKPNDSPLISSLFKAGDWEYEKEWRLVIPTMLDKASDLQEYYEPIKGFRNHFFVEKLIMPKPKAIYLGSKIDINDEERLLQIASSKNIEVYKMKLKPNEFKMTPEKISFN